MCILFNFHLVGVCTVHFNFVCHARSTGVSPIKYVAYFTLSFSSCTFTWCVRKKNRVAHLVAALSINREEEEIADEARFLLRDEMIQCSFF